MGEAKNRKLAGTYPTPGSAIAIPPLDSNPAWGLSRPSVQEHLERLFDAEGIDYSSPAFHDSPAFVAAEQRNPAFVANYARYVEARTYSAAALVDAQRKASIAARAVGEAVRSDGRKGKCVVAAGVLSRMLDELGIWNYVAKATLTVTFPSTVSREARYFYVLDRGGFVAAHAFVVAPPFVVIDPSLKFQHWDLASMERALPALVLQEGFTPYEWQDEDLASAEVRAALRGQPVLGLLQSRHRQMLELMSQLPGRLARYPGGELRYVVTGVAGYQEPLSELTGNASLAGVTPLQLFQTRVLPELGATLTPT